ALCSEYRSRRSLGRGTRDRDPYLPSFVHPSGATARVREQPRNPRTQPPSPLLPVLAAPGLAFRLGLAGPDPVDQGANPLEGVDVGPAELDDGATGAQVLSQPATRGVRGVRIEQFRVRTGALCLLVPQSRVDGLPQLARDRALAVEV